MIYTYGYLFYVPITLIFGGLLIFYGIKKEKKYPYYLCVAVALLYINMAVKISIFPILIEDIPEFDISYSINLRMGQWGSEWKQLILNILLTFPIGFGIPFILDTTLIKRVFICVICGLSFEVCQLILLLTVRPINVIFDVNDLICNALGALIGLLVIQMINIPFVKYH
jgi:hypothetical protein